MNINKQKTGQGVEKIISSTILLPEVVPSMDNGSHNKDYHICYGNCQIPQHSPTTTGQSSLVDGYWTQSHSCNVQRSLLEVNSLGPAYIVNSNVFVVRQMVVERVSVPISVGSKNQTFYRNNSQQHCELTEVADVNITSKPEFTSKLNNSVENRVLSVSNTVERVCSAVIPVTDIDEEDAMSGSLNSVSSVQLCDERNISNRTSKPSDKKTVSEAKDSLHFCKTDSNESMDSSINIKSRNCKNLTYSDSGVVGTHMIQNNEKSVVNTQQSTGTTLLERPLPIVDHTYGIPEGSNSTSSKVTNVAEESLNPIEKSKDTLPLSSTLSLERTMLDEGQQVPQQPRSDLGKKGCSLENNKNGQQSIYPRKDTGTGEIIANGKQIFNEEGRSEKSVMFHHHSTNTTPESEEAWPRVSRSSIRDRMMQRKVVYHKMSPNNEINTNTRIHSSISKIPNQTRRSPIVQQRLVSLSTPEDEKSSKANISHLYRRKLSPATKDDTRETSSEHPLSFLHDLNEDEPVSQSVEEPNRMDITQKPNESRSCCQDGSPQNKLSKTAAQERDEKCSRNGPDNLSFCTQGTALQKGPILLSYNDLNLTVLKMEMEKLKLRKMKDDLSTKIKKLLDGNKFLTEHIKVANPRLRYLLSGNSDETRTDDNMSKAAKKAVEQSISSFNDLPKFYKTKFLSYKSQLHTRLESEFQKQLNTYVRFLDKYFNGKLQRAFEEAGAKYTKQMERIEELEEQSMRQEFWIRIQRCDCGKIGLLRVCRGCYCSFYCSKQCQSLDWDSHCLECQRKDILL